MRRRQSALIHGMALAALVGAVSACGIGEILGPHEAIPLPGIVHLTSEPATAPFAVSIRLIYQGQPSSGSDDFIEGATIVLDRSALPQPHGVQVNGRACTGEFTIESGVETDVQVVFADGGCSVRVLGQHPEGEGNHGNAGAVILGTAPIGSIVRLSPIDPELVTAVVEEHADEAGQFGVGPLPAGRYELALIVDGQVVRTREIVLRPGQEMILTLD